MTRRALCVEEGIWRVCIVGVWDNYFLGSSGSGETRGKRMTRSAFKEHSFVYGSHHLSLHCM